MKKQMKFNSVFFRFLAPVVGLIIILNLITYGMIYFGGTVKQLENSSISSLDSTVSAAAKDVEGYLAEQTEASNELLYLMVETESILRNYSDEDFDEENYMMRYSGDIRQDNKIVDLASPKENQTHLTGFLVKRTAARLKALMKDRALSGIYCILDGSPDSSQKQGLYFRRLENVEQVHYDADMEVLVAPSRANIDYCINFGKKDSYDTVFDFDSEPMAGLAALYRSVMAKTKVGVSNAPAGTFDVDDPNLVLSKNYAYWERVNNPSMGNKMITYNIPLLYKGVVYGVLGFEIDLVALAQIMNPAEIFDNSKSAAYLYANENEGTLEVVLESGELFAALYEGKQDIKTEKKISENCIQLENGINNTVVYASSKTMNLYGANSVYDDDWQISAIVKKSDLFSFSRQFNQYLLQAIIVGLVVGILAAAGLSLLLSRPIKKLAHEVSDSGNLESVLKTKTGIYEVDLLVGEMSSLAVRVKEFELKEKERQIKEKDIELEGARIEIMLSQIQPHFLSNTLLAIQELCLISPLEASQTAAEFSRYMRRNLESLKIKRPIPFTEELRHAKTYLAIEQKLHENKLKVVWNIETEDFVLPSLTLQPLVENAVRHGVTKRKNGGTVTVSAAREIDKITITVSDDGVGFDINDTKNSAHNRIGIENVEKRLESMCGGHLTITSEKDVGTTCTIVIPSIAACVDTKE